VLASDVKRHEWNGVADYRPSRLNWTVTDLAAPMLTLHVLPETLSHPLQLPIPESGDKAGVAVRTTVVPLT
jgi:hypothetical protein